MFIVPNRGEKNLASLAMIETVMPGFTLRLFLDEHNGAILESDETVDFTEMNVLAYAPIPLLRADGSVSTDGGGNTIVEWPLKVFTFTAGALTTIFGYLVTRDDDDTIIGAELLPYPVQVSQEGDTCKIKVKIQFE